MAYGKVVKRVAGLLVKAGAPYAVTGALAVGYYGLPRSTRGIDVLVSADDKLLKKLVRRARRSRFVLVGSVRTLGSEDFALEAREGFRADFRMAGENHDAVSLKRRRGKRLFGTRLHMVSPEDLILQKLRAGGARDHLDAAAVMMRQEGKLDLDHLRAWAEELGLADVFNALAKKVW